MKGYTGTLRLKFTARVRSRADLRRRCDKIAARLESLIGCESWSLEGFLELPGPIPLGYYGVQLCTVPIHHCGQTAPPTTSEWVVVETLTGAKNAVREYLKRHGKRVGASNWGPESGQVWDHQGEVVARFSFGLRCSFASRRGEGRK